MSAATPDAPPPPPAREPIGLRDLLRDRPFALYLIGQTTSGMGSALSSVALVFAVLSVSRSASSVGLVLLAGRLPAIVLALGGGAIADRWSRKWIAFGADVTRTALQAVTGALLLSGHATVVEIAALQCATGGASALFAPAAGALLAGVAPRGQIRRASSLLGITTAVAQTGGLAVSGVIVAFAGPGMSLEIDAATFAVSSLSLVLIPAVPVVRSPATRMLAELRDGWREVRRRGWLMSYAVSVTVINVLVLCPFFVLGPVIAKAHLGGAPAWSAIAFGYVIGNLAAAHITYHWAPRRPILAARALTVALVPLMALLGLSAPLWAVVLAAGLAGAQTTISNTLTTSAQQANLPDATLGRASAITSLGSTVLVPAGMGLAGLAAGALGTSTVMLGGAGSVMVTTVICVSLPAVRVPLALDRGPASPP